MIRFVLLLAVTATCAYGACLESWTEFNGYCFSFQKEPTVWSAAVAYCHSIGSRLVEIDSAEKDNWLGELLNASRSGSIFAGLNRRSSPEWVWDPSKRTADKYSNWNVGEPNTELSFECLAAHYGVARKWTAVSCSAPRPYFCEKKSDKDSVN
uniref:C-type lectin domain-containing protein n=1 Tax=Arion vulgaris TaxID=1028688 RepID=A0A0B7B6R1_9EUPU